MFSQDLSVCFLRWKFEECHLLPAWLTTIPSASMAGPIASGLVAETVETSCLGFPNNYFQGLHLEPGQFLPVHLPFQWWSFPKSWLLFSFPPGFCRQRSFVPHTHPAKSPNLEQPHWHFALGTGIREYHVTIWVLEWHFNDRLCLISFSWWVGRWASMSQS